MQDNFENYNDNSENYNEIVKETRIYLGSRVRLFSSWYDVLFV